jgi:hypothetical protein
MGISLCPAGQRLGHSPERRRLDEIAVELFEATPAWDAKDRGDLLLGDETRG